MYGYQEIAFSVERSADLKTPSGNQQHLEVRVTQPSPNPFAGGATPPVERYIAVAATNKAGQAVTDVLLLYRAQDQQQVLDADWERLTNTEPVDVKELNWFEMVVNHATGYTRNGGVTMY